MERRVTGWRRRLGMHARTHACDRTHTHTHARKHTHTHTTHTHARASTHTHVHTPPFRGAYDRNPPSWGGSGALHRGTDARAAAAQCLILTAASRRSQWELGGRRGGVDFELESERRRCRHDGLGRRRIAPYRREICRWAAMRGTLVLVLCPTTVCSLAGEGTIGSEGDAEVSMLEVADVPQGGRAEPQVTDASWGAVVVDSRPQTPHMGCCAAQASQARHQRSRRESLWSA